MFSENFRVNNVIDFGTSKYGDLPHRLRLRGLVTLIVHDYDVWPFHRVVAVTI